MKEGRAIKNMNWGEYKSRQLDLTKSKYYNHETNYVSCGSAMLSLITEIPVKTVEKYCPKPKTGWYTTRIVKYLREKGYTVIELTKNGILSYPHPLTKHHLLLINARADMEENSLYALHKGNIYHNFYTEGVNDPLFFFNRPTQDVLLVFHPKWKGPDTAYYNFFA